MITANSILNRIKFKSTNHSSLLPKSGIFHFDFQENGGRSRVHLRIDPDDSGLLIVNASKIVHLNPTALVMAYLILQNTDRDKAIRILTKSFDVSKDQASSDYTQTTELLHELIKPDGACPIHDLNLDVIQPFSSKPSAPYRMDLAITYRCNNDCSHCYNARSRYY